MVGKFVEFFGPGVSQLSIADRATISNMCPEYGATVGYFPVDEMSLKYLRQTGTYTLMPGLNLGAYMIFYGCGANGPSTLPAASSVGILTGLSQYYMYKIQLPSKYEWCDDRAIVLYSSYM